MKNVRRICRALAALLGLMLTTAGCFAAVSAGEGGPCTLCIQYMDETVPIQGAEFRVYRAADMLEHGEYALAGPFADSGAVLQNQMTNSAWEEAAGKLAACVKAKAIEPYAAGRTGGDGSLTLTGLPEGLYLVDENTLDAGERIFRSQAFCVALPGRGPDGSLQYGVTATPKYEAGEKPQEPARPEIVIEKEQALNAGQRTKDRLAARPFDVVTYYLTVKNISAADAQEVTVTDSIPQGLTLKKGDDAVSDGGSVQGNVITWELGTLAANTVRTVSFKVVTPRVEEYTLWKNMASVNYKENDGQPKGSNTVEADEEPIDEAKTGSITVKKKLTYRGYPIAANDAVFYVALYADKECTVRVTELAKLRFTNSSSESVTFTGLELGRTYYAGESDDQDHVFSNGEVSDGSEFMVVFSHGSSVKLDTAEETKVLEFENEFLDFPVGYLREGTLTVKKQVLDIDGQPMASDETFYVGIFEDEAHTRLSDALSENILKLPMEGGSEANASIRAYCADNEVLRLYVTEVTADGVPVDDHFRYTAEVTNGAAVISMDQPEWNVTITNQEKEESETEEPETIETEVEESTEKTTGDEAKGQTEEAAQASSEGVRTGDDTPILPYMLLLVTASCALAAGIWRRNRRA